MMVAQCKSGREQEVPNPIGAVVIEIICDGSDEKFDVEVDGDDECDNRQESNPEFWPCHHDTRQGRMLVTLDLLIQPLR